MEFVLKKRVRFTTDAPTKQRIDQVLAKETSGGEETTRDAEIEGDLWG